MSFRQRIFARRSSHRSPLQSLEKSAAFFSHGLFSDALVSKGRSGVLWQIKNCAASNFSFACANKAC